MPYDESTVEMTTPATAEGSPAESEDKTMTKILNITAATTTDCIEKAIPFDDMRGHVYACIDGGLAVELHEVAGVMIAWCPSANFAVFNEKASGAASSLLVEADSLESAVAAWRGEAHDADAFRAWAQRVALPKVSIDVLVSEYLDGEPDHYELSGQYTISGRPEVYPR
jgi:hypothetical protein